MKKPPIISDADKIEKALLQARRFIGVVTKYAEQHGMIGILDYWTDGGEVEAINAALAEMGKEL